MIMKNGRALQARKSGGILPFPCLALFCYGDGMRVDHPIFSARHLPAAVLCAAGAALGSTSGDAAGSYAPPPFAHYQPILDRMPFGELPANFNAAAVDPATLKNEAQVKAEQQAIAKKVNLSAVNVTPDGATAIGFTDLSVTPPVSHYLRVGEAAGGWVVVSADYDEETATIEKEGVPITLKLGQGLIDTPPAAATPGGNAAAAIPAAAKPLLGRALGGAAAERAALPAATPGLTVQPPAGLLPKANSLLGRTAAEKGNDGSYAERQRERATQKTQEQLAAEKTLLERMEKLANEAAARESQRRAEEAAIAAQEQAELPQEAPAETPPAQMQDVQ